MKIDWLAGSKNFGLWTFNFFDFGLLKRIPTGITLTLGSYGSETSMETTSGKYTLNLLFEISMGIVPHGRKLV